MIVDNAVDFFAQAVECFPEKPKNSVIFFDSSVELFVKARLMVEHWSLIVAESYMPDRDKFKNGDFVSVSLQEAAEKLDKTIKSGLTKEELKAFEKIKAHRNKMVHFYHKGLSKKQNEKLLQEIAKEQLTTSYLLYNRLFFTEWIDCFGPWIEDMRPLYDKLQESYTFLEVIFKHVQGEIANREKRGDIFTECPACGFKSYGRKYTMKAGIDRFESDYAVLLVGKNEVQVD